MRALRVTRTMQPQRMLVGSGAALRGYAEKAGANPWANAPKDEAALREAILKSNVREEGGGGRVECGAERASELFFFLGAAAVPA